MECHLRSEPTKRGFRKTVLAIWNERGLFRATEQQLAGQITCIKNKGWLAAVKIEETQRAIHKEDENRVDQMEAEEVELNETEIR